MNRRFNDTWRKHSENINKNLETEKERASDEGKRTSISIGWQESQRTSDMYFVVLLSFCCCHCCSSAIKCHFFLLPHLENGLLNWSCVGNNRCKNHKSNSEAAWKKRTKRQHGKHCVTTSSRYASTMKIRDKIKCKRSRWIGCFFFGRNMKWNVLIRFNTWNNIEAVLIGHDLSVSYFNFRESC